MVADYYAMLGVEPTANRDELEASLARCQSRWSLGTRNPKTKHTYQSYLDLIPALRQALLSLPEDRARYDAELAAVQRTERDKLIEDLKRLVRLRSAKGGLTPADRAALKTEAVKRGLTPAELDNLTRKIMPLPEPEAEPDLIEIARETLDPSARRQIRLALEHLRKKDLYDLLELTRGAMSSEIAERADMERQRWMQKSQVTADKTAWLEAITYAQTHLVSPDTRSRYDSTLDLENEESFETLTAFTLEGMSRMEEGTLRALKDEAQRLALNPRRADVLIRKYCRSRGIVFETSPLGFSASPSATHSSASNSPAKGSGTVNANANANSNSNPNSNASAPASAGSFTQSEAEWMDRCKDAAIQAYRTKDYHTSQTHLQRIQDKDPLNAEARRGLERIKERLDEIDRIRNEYLNERSRGRLVAACQVVEAWRLLVEPQNAEVKTAETEVVKAIIQARELASQGRDRLPDDVPGAIRFFRQSLAIAGDLPEAIDGLKRCPPPPPRDLTAECRDGKVLLRWTAPPPDGLGPYQFRILRKRQTAPANSADGFMVATIPHAEHEDEQAPAGEWVGYAVYTVREQSESLDGAKVEPFPIMSDVTGLSAEALHDEIHLSWSLPPGAVGVIVRRKEGMPPSGASDGLPVPSLRDRAIDKGVKEDRIYHYGVFAIYPGGRDSLRTSRGAFVSAWAQSPLKAVQTLHVVINERGAVKLLWTAPPRGQVRVLRSPVPLHKPRNDLLAMAEAKALPGQWLPTVAPDSTQDPNPLPDGVCHYIAFTYWAGMFAVGPEVPFARLSDPSDLRAGRIGQSSRVQLRWRWGPQGSQTLVVYKPNAMPKGPDDPSASTLLINELEYYRQGCALINLPNTTADVWHFRVFSALPVDGQRVHSPGHDPGSRATVAGPHQPVVVSYELKRGFMGLGSWRVEFRTDPPNSSIPPTILVIHPRVLPASVDDGSILDRFPAAVDGAWFPIRSPAGLAEGRYRVFIDPQADPDGLLHIELRDPPGARSRLSP